MSGPEVTRWLGVIAVLVLAASCDVLKDASAPDVVLEGLEGRYDLVELEVETVRGPYVATAEYRVVPDPRFGEAEVRVDGTLEIGSGRVRQVTSWVRDAVRRYDVIESTGRVAASGANELRIDWLERDVIHTYAYEVLEPGVIDLRLEPPAGCTTAGHPVRRWRYRRRDDTTSPGVLTGILLPSDRGQFGIHAELQRHDLGTHVLLGAQDDVGRVALTVVFPNDFERGSLSAVEGLDLGGARGLVPLAPTWTTPPDGAVAILGYLDRNRALQFVLASSGVLEVQRAPEGLRARARNLRFLTPLADFSGELRVPTATFSAGSLIESGEPVESCRQVRLDAWQAPLEGEVMGLALTSTIGLLRRAEGGYELLLRSDDIPCGVADTRVGIRIVELLVPEETGEFRIGIEASGTFRARVDEGVFESPIYFGSIELERDASGRHHGTLFIRSDNEWAGGTFDVVRCHG